MNILQLNSYYITSKLYQNLYQELSEQDIEQTIYVPIKSEAESGKNKLDDLNKGNYIYANTFNTLDRLIYYSKVNKIAKDINSRLNLKQFDLIHAHSLFVNGGVAYKLKQKYGINYITAVRSTDLNLFFKYALHLRKYGLQILQEAEKIVFISPAYRDKLIKKYIPADKQEAIKKKIIVLPNGINNLWFENMKNQVKTKLNDKKVNLIYIGQFIKRKNIEQTIAVTKELQNRGYDSNLKIIGKGKLESKLRKIADQNQDIIEIEDYLPQEKLIERYQEADIFIMPSENETFGLVYIEAMSQGLPIIYSKNEGVDGYFAEGAVGFAVNPDNKQEIADKIELILEDYENKSAQALQEAKNFSWAKIANQYFELYRQVRRS